MRTGARRGAGAGGRRHVTKLSVLPGWVLRMAGLVSPDARELAEPSDQFTAPFVPDSSRNEALLGQSPTPLDVAAKETVDWWRALPR